MGKRSKTGVAPFNPKPQVLAASFSGSSGHEFSAIAGPQAAGSSSAVCSGTPDLDIVSGFAFLSFDSLDALEVHINVNEANTSSLSVQVGQKRPQGSPSGPFEGRSGTDSAVKKFKRSPKPKPKSRKKPKLQQGLVATQECVPDDIPPKPLKSAGSSTSTAPLAAKGCDEISLLCPETLIPEDEIREVEIPPAFRSDVCVVKTASAPDAMVSEQLEAPTSDAELLLLQTKKKKKKKKKKDDSCDQTSQTMFRIKKKKKKRITHLAGENQLSNKPLTSDLTSAQVVPESVHFGGNVGLAYTSTNSEQLKSLNVESWNESEILCGSGGEIPITGGYQEVELLEGYHRSARPKKPRIEKIDWCARSGGAFVMNKHRTLKGRYHPMSLSMVQEENYSIEAGMLESATTTPEGSDLDLDIREEQLANAIKLEDNALSETSSDELPKEFLFSNETLIMRQEGEENEADPGDVEVDIESVDNSVSKNFMVVSGFKGTPLAGHFSFHPHLTRDGTVDSSIQIYANVIDIYLKCALLQHGKIIKVITPDKDEFEGKFPKNPNGQKAVRSLTERKRRNFLGQMFTSLKKEVFTDLSDKELYFSKQTILTKATATVDELVKRGAELSSMKAQLKDQSRVLKEKLNHLVFGESARADQVVDTEKLGSVLKHFNIEVEEPLDVVTKVSDSHVVKAAPPAMSSSTQTPSVVDHDEERECYGPVKATTVATAVAVTMATTTEGITTAIASKPSVTPAPKLVLKVVTDAMSKQSDITSMARSVPYQVSKSSGKIICNLSRLSTQRSTGSQRNICVVTNMNPAMKSLERKNVMHIKITNDVLKQIDDVSVTSHGQQAKANPEPRKLITGSASSVIGKPQVMLGITSPGQQPKANPEPRKLITGSASDVIGQPQVMLGITSPGQQAKTNLEPRKLITSSSACNVIGKPQVMLGITSPGQQAKANPEPRKLITRSASDVIGKPQVMLGTLIATKAGPPIKKVVQLPPSPEPSIPQVKAKQSSGRHLRPILPHPPATEVLAGISNIVNTVNSPSVVQHLSLPQKSGSSTPIVFSKIQDSEKLDVNEPVIQGKQSPSEPQIATGIDGLQGVVDKLSQEQQSLVMKSRKILVPIKGPQAPQVPQAEVILFQSGAFSVLPKPSNLGSTCSSPNPISHLSSSPGFGGSTTSTTSGLSSTQPPPYTHASSSGLQLILGRAPGITATTVTASQVNSAIYQQPNVNVSNSSYTTFVSPRISGGVQATSPLALINTPQTFHVGKKPSPSTESVSMSSPFTVCSVPASAPGRLYAISSQTAAVVLQKKDALVGHTSSVPLSTDGSQHFSATVSTAAPVVLPVSDVSGATQHRQMAIKSPLSNMQSPVLPPKRSASCVIPLHSFSGGTGIINPNPVITHLCQGALQAGTQSTSVVHYSSPSTQVKKSMFPQSVSSPTTLKVSYGVPVTTCDPKVQVPQPAVLQSLQNHSESAAHSNIPARTPVVVGKPWIMAHQISRGVSLAQPGDQCSLSVQSSNSSKMLSLPSPLNVPHASVMEMRGSVPALPQVLPCSEAGNFSADIVWPQVSELAPVSHYIIPAVGGAGSLAQAEESSNIPSAFVTRIPVTDWRESVDIPYLVGGDSLEASEESANLPSREMTVDQGTSFQLEGDQLKEQQTNPMMPCFDVRDHTYSKQKGVADI